DKIVARVPLRIQELSSTFDVKTKDNVFVSLPVHIQVRVMPDDVQKAYYELQNPNQQIQSYVLTHMRAGVNNHDFAGIYSDKEKIEQGVMQALDAKLKDYGYTVVNVLVDEPNPGEDITQAYNSVIASQRKKEAAENFAEAEKITKVKDAEADAEAMKLSGQGIADQRKAIVNGLEESIAALIKAVPGMSTDQATEHLMELFRLDTIKAAAAMESNTILMTLGAEKTVRDAPDAVLTGAMARKT
ncbi:MAG: SPFH domain-containing protein, partial [Alphaproteobacteria bacterium]